MNINIRPFEETDYATIVAIENQAFPDTPTTVEQVQFGDAVWNQDCYFQRLVIEVDDEAVGRVSIYEPPWSYAPGRYGMLMVLHPDWQRQGIGTYTMQHCFALFQQREIKPEVVETMTREDRLPSVNFLQKHGWQPSLRIPRSELQVKDFDFTRYESLRQGVAESGVQILNLTELKQSYPDDWVTRLYEPVWEMMQDVPTSEPPIKPAIESVEKRFDSPNIIPEAYLFAVDGGQVVGLTSLRIDAGNPKKLVTALTGVVRSHRRRGIATAMKVKAIEVAHQRGIEMIETDNEENNPMFQINLKLGFVPLPAYVEYVKHFS